MGVLWIYCIVCMLYFTHILASSTCPSKANLYVETGPIWSPWGACDHPCGGGVRKRTGACQYSKLPIWWNIIPGGTEIISESSSCNQFCYHGSFKAGSCLCQQGIKGRCCEIVPVCDPKCQNGGSCIADNLCKCQTGFYGQWCELGGDLGVKLRPQLVTRVPLNVSDQPNSWYDVTDTSDFNRACFFKLHFQNAPLDLLVTSTSTVSEHPETVFGQYSAGPIDDRGGLNGTSRFSCQEVRCPGWMTNGTEQDVSVNVTIATLQNRCKLSNYSGNLNMFRQHTSGSGFTFALEAGNNYGSSYGIYTGMGFRDKAGYLAQHSCFSGRRFDLANMNPDFGVLAWFTCT